jgi:hypothetical protein
MGNYAPNAWSEIIAKAALSPLGIAALVLLIVGFVVISLVRPVDKPQMRVAVIVLLMLFCGGLLGAAIYSAQPTALPTSGTADRHEAVPGSSSSASPTRPPAAPPTAPTQSSPTPATAATRTDCGAAWSDWIEIGGGVGNPCPSNCSRGDELGQSYRAVGFPPRPQTKHKFQCWRL